MHYWAVMGILADGRDLSGEDIIGICRLINFKLITGLLKQSSLTPDDEFYQNVVRKEFQKKDRTFDLEKLQLIAGLFRRQLEDSLLTSVQVKWLVNSEPKLEIKLYGTGWEQIWLKVTVRLLLNCSARSIKTRSCKKILTLV